MLHTVSREDEDTLRQTLHQLIDAELLYQRGLPPHATYLFKHALIQDAAYQSLLKSTRQQYHTQIAQVLEKRFPEAIETQPELLAHHYTEAGLVAQAIPYWQQAGQRAAQRSANMEAISHLTEGLELLKTLPGTSERAQQELTLQITLGNTLMVAKGYAAPEVEKAYVRARELSQQAGETPQLFLVLFGLRSHYFVRAELQTAREVGEQLLTLAQRVQDSALRMEAYRLQGTTVTHLGEFTLARAYLEKGIALYDPRQHRDHAFLYAQDPGVAGLSYAALALWYLGYPDQARKRINEALTLARELSHPFSLAYALWFAAWLHQHSREGRAAQERAETTITLSAEQRFPQWLALGAILQGWALAEQGQTEEGIAQIQQGLAAFRGTGAELARPYHLALLAEVYGKVGQAEEGLSVLTKALAQMRRTGERAHEAELYRLNGELTLQQFKVQSSRFKVANSQPLIPNPQTEVEAETCFLKAIEIARRQSAKSWELRAAMSLSRLWQQQGKKEAARQMLEEIYGWFTEGFDAKDLQEAKALLEALA